MRKIYLYAIIACFLSTGFTISKVVHENKMDSFKWLIDSWTMKRKNGSTIMETWTALNDSTLAGESLNFSISGQSTVLENLQLAYRGKEYYYISRVNGQNNNEAVKFKITSYSDKGFIAENPEHDFPKRITYELINKDSIHAFIDGGTARPDKKSDFYYSRYKN